jgi:opacity protein-like surface antigen
MKPLLCVLTILFAFAQDSPGEGFKVGGSLGHYFMADSVYEDTYGSGSLIYEGFLGYDLSRRLEIRAAVGYFKDKGEMTLTREEITFSMVPVVVGMRVKLAKWAKLDPYLGLGVDFYSFKERARLGDTSGSTTGFHLEGGSYVALGQRLFVDVNLRYVKADAQPYGEVIRLGGWRAGVGMGYSF